MKLGFEIVCIDTGKRGSIYTIQFEDRHQKELDLFLNDQENQQHPEFGELITVLFNIPHDGIPKGYYTKTKNYEAYGWVRPFKKYDYTAQLRIYCIHPERTTLLIFGNGGIKSGGGLIRNYPRLIDPFNRVCYVDKRLDERLRESKITIVGNTLRGDLTFGPYE